MVEIETSGIHQRNSAGCASGLRLVRFTLMVGRRGARSAHLI